MLMHEIIELKKLLTEAKKSLRLAIENFEFEEQKLLQEKISGIKIELQRHLITK
jgi:hypothetical protein